MFYDIFEKLCVENGVTPVQVRRDLGISQSTMASWKSRGLTPNAVTLVQLAEYFHTTPAYLAGNPMAKHPENSLRAVVCAIPSRFHSEIFQKLREIGIPMDKIVRESKYGSFVGEGFIVEELTPEEQIRVSNAINKVMFRDMPHQDSSEATAAPQSPPGKDTPAAQDAPEGAEEGE